MSRTLGERRIGVICKVSVSPASESCPSMCWLLICTGCLIRIATVSLHECTNLRHEALATFIRCLHFLPNVHTVRVISAPCMGQWPHQFTRDVFASHIYPTVHTIMLPMVIINVLRSFPAVRAVHCMRWQGSDYPPNAAEHWHRPSEEILSFGHTFGQ